MDPMKPNRGGDELERMLDELGKLEREERRAGEELPDAPGLRNVERVLEDVWAEEPQQASPRRTWIYWGALAAAAAALIAWVLLHQPTPPAMNGTTGEMLNDGVFRVLHPASLEASWPDRIQWSGPEGVTYSVRVVEEQPAGAERVLLGPQQVRGFELPLSAETTRTWPKRVRVDVEYRRKDGRQVPPKSDWWELAH